MIVMKFGGSSLGSAASISRVVSIIRTELHRRPVIIVSALGDTTDLLQEVATAARTGDNVLIRRLLDALQNQHFAVCEEFLNGAQRDSTDRYLQGIFRDLHVRMLELTEGELPFTAELQDWVLGLGEQLSSRLVAAVLEEHCGPAQHLDSRRLILTDGNFTNAQPRYWETYARIRWTLPFASRDKLVVLGGFIGSTVDGCTTTLGRGGSDLTASIVGAALNADEIQVWKDVDGMLTCDPRVLRGGCQVRHLRYEEATELARAGATILHPETIEPAQRLHIPIVIRNTFCPSAQGTRIDGTKATVEDVVKSIAIKKDITLLEICSSATYDDFESLIAFCRENSSAATILGSSASMIYIAVDENSRIPEETLPAGSCVRIRARTRQALVTLVGGCQNKEAISKKVKAVLQRKSAFLFPTTQSDLSIRIAVPQQQLKQCLGLLHRSFFSNPDPRFFVAGSKCETRPRTAVGASSPQRLKTPKGLIAANAVLQTN